MIWVQKETSSQLQGTLNIEKQAVNSFYTRLGSLNHRVTLYIIMFPSE